MRRILTLLAALPLLSACAAPAGEARPSQPLPAQEASEPPAPAEESPEDPEEEAEDRALLTLEAPLTDGRTLTLEAFGRRTGEYSYGVREVRVYDGEELLQTVPAPEAIKHFWGGVDLLPGESVSEYTSCWSPEETMEVLDLNFDGNADFGLFGWTANNTIPYYYWIWDEAAGEYRYAFVLQGAKARPETGELSAAYKSGMAGSQWITEYYKPGGNGELYLDRVERDLFDFKPGSGQLDADRGGAGETWVPPEGRAPIPPGDGHWGIESDLVLVRREVPVLEINGDRTASYFNEIWEWKDGTFQMTSREEYFYDDSSE